MDLYKGINRNHYDDFLKEEEEEIFLALSC
jgi:hypothetical protein